MNKKLIIALTVIGAIALTAGAVNAAGFFVESLQVGSQDTGGVTFFNGSIVNNTTTDDVDNPVTFGDNVRIDGRVWRGAEAGPADSMPFIVNDNMEVTGNLSITGTLTAATVQELVSGDVTSAGSLKTAAASPSTWSATTHSVCDNEYKTATATVTFTPTTSTTGTWSSVGYNIFNPGASGSGICFGSTKLNYTFTGKYKMINNYIMTWDVVSSDSGALSVGYVATAETHGNQIMLTETRNSPQLVSILTPQ